MKKIKNLEKYHFVFGKELTMEGVAYILNNMALTSTDTASVLVAKKFKGIKVKKY